MQIVSVGDSLHEMSKLVFCQVLFFGKNKKTIVNLSPIELAWGVVKVIWSVNRDGPGILYVCGVWTGLVVSKCFLQNLVIL